MTTVLRVVNRPIETVVIHKADNAVELHGKVTGKSMVGKLYTIDCGAYGKFLVSKEQYDAVNVGDDIPGYLRARAMIPSFRAWDGGSLCRMYSPEEVWVCDGGIWVIDEDS